jgi:hypothetical protein
VLPLTDSPDRRKNGGSSGRACQRVGRMTLRVHQSSRWRVCCVAGRGAKAALLVAADQVKV